MKDVTVSSDFQIRVDLLVNQTKRISVLSLKPREGSAKNFQQRKRKITYLNEFGATTPPQHHNLEKRQDREDDEKDRGVRLGAFLLKEAVS